ncbi:DapH/DapD/GlmU-related protein [Micrococcaceae bacterium Sec5.7]
MTIGNGVWIGAGAIILPGAVIEDGCIIAAGAVVRGHCSADQLWAGVPATLKRPLSI